MKSKISIMPVKEDEDNKREGIRKKSVEAGSFYCECMLLFEL